MTKNMSKRLSLAAALLSFAACSKTNPYYCEDSPGHNCAVDAGDDGGPQSCTASEQCAAGKPVCDTNEGTCVACTATEPGACAGTTPVCSTNQTCVPCATHGQCTTSNACLPTGACGDDATVAYVAASGSDANPCTKAEPCATVSSAATKGKAYIKIEGNLDEAILLDGVDVTLLAVAGTQLTRTASPGPVLEIRGSSNVVLEDLVITGALGSTGHGLLVGAGQPSNLTLERVHVINNGGNGLNIQGGKLTMTRSVVSGNTLGGAIISASFEIINTLFVVNGSGTATTGGATLTPPSASSIFRFNTVANNMSSSGAETVRGINCTLPMTISSTIVSGNQVSSNCTFEYSLFDPGTTVSGSNKAGDPAFRNDDAVMALAPDYFRIGTTSAAIDSGDPTSTIVTDIDGDSRPMGGERDIGADEVQ